MSRIPSWKLELNILIFRPQKGAFRELYLEYVELGPEFDFLSHVDFVFAPKTSDLVSRFTLLEISAVFEIFSGVTEFSQPLDWTGSRLADLPDF